MDRIFYMEVGRSAITGEGDYWMKAEDSNIAQNMHAAILNAMSSSSNKDKDRDKDNDMVPKPRLRSSSANEASKPILVLGGRRPTGHKLHGFSPLGKFDIKKKTIHINIYMYAHFFLFVIYFSRWTGF